MTIPLTVYRTASELASERLEDPFVGLHVGVTCPRGSYGILELTAHHAPNVGEALLRVVRYMPLVTESRLELRQTEDELALVHRIPGEPHGLGRHANEFAMACFLRFVRDTSQTPVPALRAEFAHPAPPDVSELEQFFGTSNLVFDVGRNQLVLDPKVASLPINTSDERLLPWLDSYASSLLPPESSRAERIPGLQEQIRLCLREETPPTLRVLAQRLRLSPRTLQRRLQGAHTSFQGELEEVRRDLAESYLRDPKWTIKAIALRLGYADRSGFERAFMKWRRTTPGEFRRSLPPAPDSMQET
ncbi:AraC family transcriptional regulator [Pendulispora albinea]|uniref:AraC family transcriptional regulator n=1 Tax=Pendulispora albinea TaxID=2741071 RepID=A0ABZ2M3A8_9BACT